MLKRIAYLGTIAVLLFSLSACDKKETIKEYNKDSQSVIEEYDSVDIEKNNINEGISFNETTNSLEKETKDLAAEKSNRILEKNKFLEKLGHDDYISSSDYEELDNLLNEIYKYLQKNMAKDEFEKLKQDEINWIKFKEKIKEGGDSWRGCTIKELEAKYTRERCYYLISLIDELKYNRSTTLVTLGTDIKIDSQVSDEDINEIIELLEELASNEQTIDIIYYYVDSINKDGNNFLVNIIRYGVKNDCIYSDYKTGEGGGYTGADFYCKINFDDKLSLKENCCKRLDEKRDVLPRYKLTISQESKTLKLVLKEKKYIKSTNVTKEEVEKLDELSRKIKEELSIRGIENFKIEEIASRIELESISKVQFDSIAKYRDDTGFWWMDYGYTLDIDGDNINDFIVKADYGTNGSGMLVFLKGLEDGTYESTTIVESSSYDMDFINYKGTIFEFRDYPGWGGKELNYYEVVLWKNGREAERKYIELKIQDYEITGEENVDSIYSEIVKKGEEGLEKSVEGLINGGYDLGTAEVLLSEDIFSSEKKYQCDINNDGVLEEYSKKIFFSSTWYHNDCVIYKLNLNEEYPINEGICLSFWVDKDKMGENIICIIDGMAEYDKELIGYKIKDSQCIEVFRIKRAPKIEVIVN